MTQSESTTTIRTLRKKQWVLALVVLLGYFAWKQPQQVTALTYYLTMGGKPDIEINLDGHNEIVDANTNYRKGVFPAYPWLWYNLASNTMSAKELRLIGEIRYWKNPRHSTAKFAKSISYGVSTNVLWYFLDRLIGSGIEQRSVRLSELQSSQGNWSKYCLILCRQKANSCRIRTTG